MTQEAQGKAADAVQRVIAKLIATSPAGHNLLLIGGFRYRFLGESVRSSNDIDYHWAGDLEAKQRELIALFQKKLIPLLRRQFGYEGNVTSGAGPDAGSPAVSTVVLAVWKTDVEYGRIEIPIEITRVVCADKTEVRTMDGVVFPTISDADLIESKILAVFNRSILQHRDLVDVFLFGNQLVADSPRRLALKLKTLDLSPEDVKRRLDDLEQHASYHAKAIQAVVDSQLEPVSAANLNAAGGGAMILATALAKIRRQLA